LLGFLLRKQRKLGFFYEEGEDFRVGGAAGRREKEERGEREDDDLGFRNFGNFAELTLQKMKIKI